MGSLSERQRQLLRLAHEQPGLTRAQTAAVLGASTGTMTGLVRALAGAGLLAERPSIATGERGRPTGVLVAHPQGPLVLAAAVDHDVWRVAAVELGGRAVADEAAAHHGDGRRLLADLRAAVARMADRFPGRLRGMGIALPGVVRGSVLLDAPLLGWRDLDLGAAWPPPARSGPGAGEAGPFVAGNDATLAALGEARRGAARDSGLHLHLHLDAGLGGALTLDGAVLTGAHGLAGEFGHMPFGDPAVRCPCGAHGCWTTAVGAGALAAALGEALPRDALSYGRTVLDRAARGEPAARDAVAAVAGCLGRGIAALVNGLDVGLVTLGGLAPAVAAGARESLAGGLSAGLMQFRRSASPDVVAGALGDHAVQIGAAEAVWGRLWERL